MKEKSVHQANKLIFGNPAASWNEAAPLGNGMLGAMVFGAIEKELICMNEDSLWTCGNLERSNPDAHSHISEIRSLLKSGKIEQAQKMTKECLFSRMPHAAHYEPLGQVWIEKSEKIQGNYKRILNLDTAIGNIVFKNQNGICEKREFFLSAPDNVLVYRIQSENDKKQSFDIYLTRRDISRGRSISYVEDIFIEDHVIFLVGSNKSRKNSIDYAMGLTIRTDGMIKKRGSRMVVEKASEVIVYVTGRTSFRTKNPEKWCKKILDAAKEQPYDEIRMRHIKNYQRYYNRITLHLGNRVFKGEDKNGVSNIEKTVPELLEQVRCGEKNPFIYELYFNFGRYLFISCSRPGSLPANLQGIWSYEFNPCWGSRYTININMQMNYWMAEKIGLSECHMPLLEHLKRMLENGKKIASDLYGARGMCAHHNTDIWGDCAPSDYYEPSTVWPMGAAWMALHIWEHFEYTQDKEFLREYFEVLEENVLFFLDYMFLDEDGYYKTGPSVSPENMYLENGQKSCICNAPTMDIEIVRELFVSYLEACSVLQAEGYSEEVKKRLIKLPPICIGKYGQIMEWQKDYEEVEKGHRHISQLFALYPASQIRRDKTPELADAAYQTIKRRLSNGGGHTGWSCAWIIHFFARLGKAEMAYHMCRKLLAESTLDNLLDNHPPFQIDGNFGGANGILEMLVQDYGEDVYLLPALPQEWSEGKLEGISLKCGGLLFMEWKSSNIVHMTIEAKRDLRVMIFYNKQKAELQIEKNGKYEV